MATAVASTTEKIKDLLGKADEIQAGITAQEAELAKVMAQIRDTADAGSGDYQINAAPATKPAQATATAPPQQPAKAANGRRKKAATKKASSAPKAANGRRKKNAAATKKVSSKPVAPGKRNYDNEMSLREAIWDVVDRPPAKWRKALPELPKEAIGLRAVEIVKIIEEEGKWQSASSNIAPQVTQHLTKFREEGKMARGDGKRYYIVEGAEIDGPALDEEGKPVE